MNPDFKWTTRAEKLEVVRYWWREQRGICWICKDREQPMEPYTQVVTSPWAASIEHLIPKRENGPDTVGNVRLAHRWCNNVLGALWQANKDRTEKGLDPLSVKWALATTRGNLSATHNNKNRAKIAAEGPARKARGEQWRRLNAELRAPLPRGATLPKEPSMVPAYAHSAYKPPRKLTGLELARLLRKQHGWPLA